MPVERLPFLSLSVTNGDKLVWTGSAAIIGCARTGGIGLKWSFFFFLSQSTLRVKKMDRT